jgi:hypothetical protein
MKGGILKYGIESSEIFLKFFMIVNGTEGPSLCLSGVEMEFVSKMNSTVLILGGEVTLDNVKVNNQPNTLWISPFVLSQSSTFSVTVNVHSCTITNSMYGFFGSFIRSAVVHFLASSEPITFNMSHCLIQNDSFNINGGNGGLSLFHSYNTSSGMIFFFF